MVEIALVGLYKTKCPDTLPYSCHLISSMRSICELLQLQIQWCEERMRLSCSECKEFSNLIGSQSLAAQILLV